ncbi:MAG: hypothetical protein A2Y76_08755 [Planctomycetes bacterium RBG_13_60_9]|nr:MAG: hypothetical protein A2Y76_08755 [Planctomycetes bacterium RBG_13_60_9]
MTKTDTGITALLIAADKCHTEVIQLLLGRGADPYYREPRVIDCLISKGASLLTYDAAWTDRNEAHDIYSLLKRYDSQMVVEGLARRVMQNTTNRLQVLFLGVKLGIPGTEERLNEILDKHGNKKMAEDFLNSGSRGLYQGGAQWAHKHGYQIWTGMGSHRVSWGRF